MPNRSSASALVLRADGLSRVLDDTKVVTIGDLHDRVHFGNLSVQVHGNDGPRSIGYRGLDLSRINIEGERVDVYEDGFAPSLAAAPEVAKNVYGVVMTSSPGV